MSEPTSDAALLASLRADERTAWDHVWRAHGPRLERYARRLTHDPHDAADLVQETLVRTLPALARLPDGSDIGAYLCASLRNRFLTGVVRGRRSVVTADVPEPPEPAALEEDPERAALLSAQRAAVRAAIARLAPRQREALALYEVAGLPYAAIAARLDLNENAVAQLISRARLRLRAEFRREQVDEERLSEACRGRLGDLSALLDGALPDVRRRELEPHLAACPACLRSFSELREAQTCYRALAPIGLLFAADEAHAAERSPRGGRRVARLLAGAAGVVLALAVGGGVALVVAESPVETIARAAASAPPLLGEVQGRLAERGGPAALVADARGGAATALTLAVPVVVTTAPIAQPVVQAGVATSEPDATTASAPRPELSTPPPPAETAPAPPAETTTPPPPLEPTTTAPEPPPPTTTADPPRPGRPIKGVIVIAPPPGSAPPR